MDYERRARSVSRSRSRSRSRSSSPHRREREDDEESERSYHSASEAEEDNRHNRKSDGGDDNTSDEEKKKKAEEEKKKKKKPTKVRIGPVKRMLISEDMLIGSGGLSKLGDKFKDFKFQGKGREKQDLDKILSNIEQWIHTLHPKYQFDQCLERIEYLGMKKKKVKTYLRKMRMGFLPTFSDERDIIDNDDDHLFPTEEDMQGIESEMRPAGPTAESDDDDNGFPNLEEELEIEEEILRTMETQKEKSTSVPSSSTTTKENDDDEGIPSMEELLEIEAEMNTNVSLPVPSTSRKNATETDDEEDCGIPSMGEELPDIEEDPSSQTPMDVEIEEPPSSTSVEQDKPSMMTTRRLSISDDDDHLLSMDLEQMIEYHETRANDEERNKDETAVTVAEKVPDMQQQFMNDTTIPLTNPILEEKGNGASQ